MNQIEIDATYKSPRIVFNPLEGKLSIEGKSILVKVEEFYRPLIDWFDEYIKSSNLSKVEFTFDIEYFNLASTKRFLYFLVKLKDQKDLGKEITVNWVYSSNDKYVYEMGQDLAQMLKMDFNFVSYEKLKERVFNSN
jgi:hypothetical protein